MAKGQENESDNMLKKADDLPWCLKENVPPRIGLQKIQKGQITAFELIM